jgi:mannose-6-phosphate isomerase-like protein (cupin superfamily)
VNWETKRLAEADDVRAPDGSTVSPLLAVEAGSFCHCTLPAGAVSRSVRHSTVTEVWYVLDGAGELWRAVGEEAETVGLAPGTCISIPRGASFQFRASSDLRIFIGTFPAWPGEQEAVATDGAWEPSV